MIRGLLDFLYRSKPAEFKSAFGLSESVARLRAATRRSAFGVLAEQAAAGPVDESRVRLQRVIPMVGNSFKPFFFGRFEARDEGVYLTGCFTMLGFVKGFMTLWFGGLLAFGIASALKVIKTGGGAWLLILGDLGMLVAGVALVGFGKWLARNDVEWLSNTIRTALGAPTAQASGLSAQTAWTHSVSSQPTVLRITALLLLFMGMMGVWSAISGIFSWPLRLAIGVYGLWTLGLAVGVYRRSRWAWQQGLVFIGAAGLTSILQAFTSSQFPDSVVVRAIFCVLSLAVAVYWGWWWYAQRAHFQGE